MSFQYLYNIGRGLLLAMLLAFAPMVQAQDAERHQLIDGLSVYLGVLPIQMAANEADELQLPAAVYSKKHRYYVLFALFDADSGRRITDASLKARVQALGGLDFSEKKLKPIHIEQMVSYGNYFHMADEDTYHIRVWIRRAGQAQPVSGMFVFRRPKD